MTKSSTNIAEMSTNTAENSTKEHKTYKEYGCEFCNKPRQKQTLHIKILL